MYTTYRKLSTVEPSISFDSLIEKIMSSIFKVWFKLVIEYRLCTTFALQQEITDMDLAYT